MPPLPIWLMSHQGNEKLPNHCRLSLRSLTKRHRSGRSSEFFPFTSAGTEVLKGTPLDALSLRAYQKAAAAKICNEAVQLTERRLKQIHAAKKSSDSDNQNDVSDKREETSEDESDFDIDREILQVQAQIAKNPLGPFNTGNHMTQTKLKMTRGNNPSSNNQGPSTQGIFRDPFRNITKEIGRNSGSGGGRPRICCLSNSYRLVRGRAKRLR